MIIHKDPKIYNQLERLLLSCKEDNVELALQLAKGQGYPLIEELRAKYEPLPFLIIGKLKAANEKYPNINDLRCYSKLLAYEQAYLYAERGLITKNIDTLQNLKELHFMRFKQLDLPETITNIPNLTEVWISYSELTQIPEKIFKINCLKTLVLCNTNISDINERIFTLSTFERLVLEGNEISSTRLEELKKKYPNKLRLY